MSDPKDKPTLAIPVPTGSPEGLTDRPTDPGDGRDSKDLAIGGQDSYGKGTMELRAQSWAMLHAGPVDQTGRPVQRPDRVQSPPPDPMARLTPERIAADLRGGNAMARNIALVETASRYRTDPEGVYGLLTANLNPTDFDEALRLLPRLAAAVAAAGMQDRGSGLQTAQLPEDDRKIASELRARSRRDPAFVARAISAIFDGTYRPFGSVEPRQAIRRMFASVPRDDTIRYAVIQQLFDLVGSNGVTWVCVYLADGPEDKKGPAGPVPR